MTAPTDTGTGSAGDPGTTATPAGAAAFTPIASQADLDRIIGERLARQKAQFGDVEALKAKAAKLDEIEAKSKTELERATEAAKAHEARAAAAEMALLRRDVAAAKGVPAELADRLSGKTREEMEADADKLLGVINGRPGGNNGTRHVTDLRPGALPAGGQQPSSGSDWMRAQASRQ
jgi:hypothetical protein